MAYSDEELRLIENLIESCGKVASWADAQDEDSLPEDFNDFLVDLERLEKIREDKDGKEGDGDVRAGSNQQGSDP